MTARDTWVASSKSAAAARVASDLSNVVAFQSTLDASGANAGFASLQTNNAPFVTATKNANAALLVARIAETAAQFASIDAAREALRAGSTDLAPY